MVEGPSLPAQIPLSRCFSYLKLCANYSQIRCLNPATILLYLSTLPQELAGHGRAILSLHRGLPVITL